MTRTAVRTEGLGKRYRIGAPKLRTRTLREAIMNAAAAPLRNFGRLRALTALDQGATTDIVWALRDVSLEIREGEVVGIIGRNGAGKSTLLKILSRITEPTSGFADIYGRVGSLLEVGTGFHQELTGRDNIYLSGSILGMDRGYIDRRFDEIVEFAGIGPFLDTPVKRYSSGMYLRLAFAVAAHLEPDVLIVDEVLAVGDAEFQQKCLGRMDNAAQEGRTVLFVSHNMHAIQRLCNRTLLLEHGQLVQDGPTVEVVTRYLARHSSGSPPGAWVDLSDASHKGTGEARYTAVRFSSGDPATSYQPYRRGPLEVSVRIASELRRPAVSLAFALYDQDGMRLLSVDSDSLGRPLVLMRGISGWTFRIPQLFMKPGVYVLGLWLGSRVGETLDRVEAIRLEVIERHGQPIGARRDPRYDGIVDCEFSLEETVDTVSPASASDDHPQG
jgi:lipopolysaccharide transport system ATP-binding protein